LTFMSDTVLYALGYRYWFTPVLPNVNLVNAEKRRNMLFSSCRAYNSQSSPNS
jgi:hypothetical protein